MASRFLQCILSAYPYECSVRGTIPVLDSVRQFNELLALFNKHGVRVPCRGRCVQISVVYDWLAYTEAHYELRRVRRNVLGKVCVERT